MRWHDLVFCHWRMDAGEIQARLPAGLTVDTFDGNAWLSTVSFGMRDVRLRGGLGIPGHTQLRELNLRTYVKGDRPGIWFFTIDCESRPITEVIRRTFYLPYLKATFGDVDLPSVEVGRTDGRAPPAKFKLQATPAGPGQVSTPGSLDEFLHERYSLISQDKRRRLWRGEVHHEPYAVSPADATIHEDSVLAGWSARGRVPDRVTYCKGFPVVAWGLEPLS